MTKNVFLVDDYTAKSVHPILSVLFHPAHAHVLLALDPPLEIETVRYASGCLTIQAYYRSHSAAASQSKVTDGGEGM